MIKNFVCVKCKTNRQHGFRAYPAVIKKFSILIHLEINTTDLNHITLNARKGYFM